nr:hypothetical protein [Ktedonobacteraceae bacterium]
MKSAGRPRRSEEKPDSPFGKLLKEHIRRVENFTQAELARESLVAEKTLSNMVKGKRTRGTELRRDLREIIKALHKKGALYSLEEANALMTKIPTVKELDERDLDDAEIIEMLKMSESGLVAPHPDRHQAPTLPQPSPLSLHENEAVAPRTDTSSMSTTPTPGGRTRQGTRRWVSAVLVVLAIMMGVVVIVVIVFFTRPRSSPPTISSQLATTCSANANEVTLYTDINYQGQCHSFGPGNYELALSGLEENVSSIKDPNGAYHITLFDKGKNFFYLDKDAPILPAEWDNRADTMLVEKNRPTSCHFGSNGIIAFLNPDYSGGCLFITGDIANLAPFNFDGIIVSIQFVGSYQNTRQLVIYRQPNYKDKCGAYWQDQSDLRQCARLALSVQVLPFSPPTPIPTVAGTHFAGNVAPQATLSPGGTQAVIDGNLHTEWVGGHMAELDLHWAFPVTIQRVVVWDRKQSATDNNQINKLRLSFSDGTSTGSIDMISGGPRCADVTFPEKTVSWLHIIPVDASGNNGYSEVEVWATTGPQYSNNSCVNKVVVAQTVPEAVGGFPLILTHGDFRHDIMI